MWLPAVVLMAAVVIVYLPVISQGTYIWDDARYVTENPTLHDLDGLRRIWFELGATIQYYPMVFSTFWVENHIWGLAPRGYHIVNVLLHALSAILLWQVLRRLAVPGAWLAAAIFALHPVHVESVAWIAERKNVLSGMFYLSALLCYVRFALPEEGEDPATRRWGLYAAALVFFLFALLSKTVTCSLPAVILLLLWWKRGRLAAREWLPLAPMFLVGIVMAMVTTWMEKTNVHAVGPEWDLSFVERVLIAGRAVWFYAGKLLVPHPLIFNYPRWTIDVSVWWQWLFPLALVAVIAALWLLRQRIGRMALVVVLVFAGTLLPALGFIDVYPMRYAFVADHFQYLASIALIALIAAGLTTLLRRPGRRTAIAVPLVILVGLGLLTMRQGWAYQDRATLWRDTLAKNPDSFLAHCNLGSLLLEDGRADEARPHLEEAVRLKPDMHEALGALGKALVDLGEVEAGKAYYREAIRVKPAMAWAHQSLATALAAQDSLDVAIAIYRQALQIEPDFVEAHYNLGNALAAADRPVEAIDAYYQALVYAPDEPGVHNNLGNVLVAAGRSDDAVTHYRAAISARPDYGAAHRNLALVLMQQRDLQGAIQSFWLALRADPSDVVAHFGLAECLRATGQLDGAVKEYRRTLSLDPEHAGAKAALAEIEAQQGAGNQGR